MKQGKRSGDSAQFDESVGRVERRQRVRRRLERHLRDLLAAGAAAGTMVGSTLACACDPAPEPMVCPIEYPDLFRGDFTWQEVPGADPLLYADIYFYPYSMAKGEVVAIRGEPTVSGASVLSSVWNDTGVELALAPHGASLVVEVRVPFGCSGTNQTAIFRVTPGVPDLLYPWLHPTRSVETE